MKLSSEERTLIEPIEQAAMLARTERWSAINSGTGNLAGLHRQECSSIRPLYNRTRRTGDTTRLVWTIYPTIWTRR